jgi:hypothetical protein
MMRVVKNTKMRKNVITPYVGPVEQMTGRMSFGSAATVVNGGTMGSVSRSHLLELSISSTTSAQIAATRGQEPSRLCETREGSKRQNHGCLQIWPSCLACRLAFHFE